MKNIEIKAKVENVSCLISKAKTLSKSDPVIIKQEDSFYHVNQGRLKLRRFENGEGELIYYDRPDNEGPKLSSYEKCSVPSECVTNIHKVLKAALGTKGDVRKVRNLFLVDQTRIHIDAVEDLGNFMELEVVLKPEDSIEEGEKIAKKIMEQLDIKEEDLISGAYVDILSKKNEVN